MITAISKYLCDDSEYKVNVEYIYAKLFIAIRFQAFRANLLCSATRCLIRQFPLPVGDHDLQNKINNFKYRWYLTEAMFIR